MHQLNISASKQYNITITDNFDNLSDIISANIKGKKIAIVTDTRVAKLYLEKVKSLISKDYEVYSFCVKEGERSKSIKTYATLLNELAKNSFTRSDALIALGGGVIGDLTAFTASTYMRGISLIAVPTTLLSMIDSSVGGKTAINLGVGKNLCGTFYQPCAVYINVNTLNTLSQKEIDCGKGEMVKYALLSDKINQEDLQNYSSEQTILKCIQIKKQIVEKDEFEQNERALLNLGHTFGHAIEALSNYKQSHGECVLQGLYLVARLSNKMCKLSCDEYKKVLCLLNQIGKEKQNNYTLEQMISQIKVDKKATKNGIKTVIIKGVGDCEICHLTIDEIRSYLG